MTHPKQLALPLPSRAARGREDFYVTTANALAVAQIEGWQIWPNRKLVLSGPKGAGKTHLAHVWAGLTGANMIPARDLPRADIPALAETPVCVEDVDQIIGLRPAEEALFHLHNLVLAQGHALLLTAATPPVQWALEVADLKSRMMGAQAAALEEPDDDLLSALLAKLFADRQIAPAEDVIPFLTRHMPRSYRAAQEIVERLDADALGRPKGVSRPLARQVLDALAPKQIGDHSGGHDTASTAPGEGSGAGQSTVSGTVSNNGQGAAQGATDPAPTPARPPVGQDTPVS